MRRVLEYKYEPSPIAHREPLSKNVRVKDSIGCWSTIRAKLVHGDSKQHAKERTAILKYIKELDAKDTADK